MIPPMCDDLVLLEVTILVEAVDNADDGENLYSILLCHYHSCPYGNGADDHGIPVVMCSILLWPDSSMYGIHDHFYSGSMLETVFILMKWLLFFIDRPFTLDIILTLKLFYIVIENVSIILIIQILLWYLILTMMTSDDMVFVYNAVEAILIYWSTWNFYYSIDTILFHYYLLIVF